MNSEFKMVNFKMLLDWIGLKLIREHNELGSQEIMQRDIASLPSVHVPVSCIHFLLGTSCGNNKRLGAIHPHALVLAPHRGQLRRHPPRPDQVRLGQINARPGGLPELRTEPRMQFGVPYPNPALQHSGGVPFLGFSWSKQDNGAVM